MRMKTTRKLPALILALVLAISCLSGGAVAERGGRPEPTGAAAATVGDSAEAVAATAGDSAEAVAETVAATVGDSAEAADETRTAPPELQKKETGFRSPAFLGENSHRYRDDELVTAIVLMEGQPAAAQPETRRVGAERRIAAQHNALRRSMDAEGLTYEETFEYGTLLNGLALRSVSHSENHLAGMNRLQNWTTHMVDQENICCVHNKTLCHR